MWWLSGSHGACQGGGRTSKLRGLSHSSLQTLSEAQQNSWLLRASLLRVEPPMVHLPQQEEGHSRLTCGVHRPQIAVRCNSSGQARILLRHHLMRLQRAGTVLVRRAAPSQPRCNVPPDPGAPSVPQTAAEGTLLQRGVEGERPSRSTGKDDPHHAADTSRALVQHASRTRKRGSARGRSNSSKSLRALCKAVHHVHRDKADKPLPKPCVRGTPLTIPPEASDGGP